MCIYIYNFTLQRPATLPVTMWSLCLSPMAVEFMITSRTWKDESKRVTTGYLKLSQVPMSDSYLVKFFEVYVTISI